MGLFGYFSFIAIFLIMFAFVVLSISLLASAEGKERIFFLGLTALSLNLFCVSIAFFTKADMRNPKSTPLQMFEWASILALAIMAIGGLVFLPKLAKKGWHKTRKGLRKAVKRIVKAAKALGEEEDEPKKVKKTRQPVTTAVTTAAPKAVVPDPISSIIPATTPSASMPIAQPAASPTAAAVAFDTSPVQPALIAPSQREKAAQASAKAKPSQRGTGKPAPITTPTPTPPVPGTF